MQIVRVMTSIDPRHGGPARHVARTSALLAERGHVVTVVSVDAAEVVDRVEAPGVALRPVGAPRTPYKLHPRLVGTLADACRTADVLVVHGVWQFPTAAARWVAARHGLPVVVVPHGMLDPWISRRSRLRRVVRGVQYRALEGRLLDRAANVVFTTEAERQATCGAWPVAAPTTVIRYGTDDPARLGEPPRLDPDTVPSDRPTVFGSLGRFHPKKRLDLAIAALAEHGSHPGLARARLALMGPPSGERDRLQSLAAARGVADRVEFREPIYGDGRFGFLRDLDCLVLPSMQENFAQVATEAFSVGTPAILSHAVNIVGTATAAGAATACEPTVGSVRGAMAAVADGTAPLSRRSARRCFESHFDIERCVDDLEQLLRDVAGGEPSR